ncbi:MAG TPA: PTS sugar transporter subunit IIA, partial [Phycisphaerales bacterium]|nr:PTS sugar transporter subunit IIA [Phycisphaerales bacterium]
MKFADFVCPDAIIPELQSTDRDAVIEELVAAIARAGAIPKARQKLLAAAVIERENEASTGMGKGIAVPHAKHKAVKKMVAAIGLSSKGIDFSSLDKQPVYSVVLLLSPADAADRHLQAMEKIFRHLNQEKFRKFLRQCQTAEEVRELL